MSLQKDYEELLIASGYADEDIRNNNKSRIYVYKKIVIASILMDKEHYSTTIAKYFGLTASNILVLYKNKRKSELWDEIKRVVQNWNRL